MLNFFKKKSKVENLMDQYKKLQQQAYKLSTISRVKSDQKHAEAQKILKEIESLEKLASKEK
jgi:hypothetical protein